RIVEAVPQRGDLRALPVQVAIDHQPYLEVFHPYEGFHHVRGRDVVHDQRLGGVRHLDAAQELHIPKEGPKLHRGARGPFVDNVGDGPTVVARPAMAGAPEFPVERPGETGVERLAEGEGGVWAVLERATDAGEPGRLLGKDDRIEERHAV